MTSHIDSDGDHPESPLVDGLAAWASDQATSATTTLQQLRLDSSERHLIFFTTSMLQVRLHYLEASDSRGYVHCNGEPCILCQVGRSKEIRDLLPAYDVADQLVGVLAISPNVRPQALRPQLMPLLQRVAANELPFCASIKNTGLGKFSVSTSPLNAIANDGAGVIKTFLEQLEAGKQDLSTVMSRVDNRTLADIREVRAVMEAKGISL